MDKIVFSSSDSEYEVIPYEVDEHCMCHKPCPYGQGWTDEEHAENVLFELNMGHKTGSQTYLVGTAPCVTRCKYSKGSPKGVKFVMCTYKYQNNV